MQHTPSKMFSNIMFASCDFLRFTTHFPSPEHGLSIYEVHFWAKVNPIPWIQSSQPIRQKHRAHIITFRGKFKWCFFYLPIIKRVICEHILHLFIKQRPKNIGLMLSIYIVGVNVNYFGFCCGDLIHMGHWVLLR